MQNSSKWWLLGAVAGVGLLLRKGSSPALSSTSTARSSPSGLRLVQIPGHGKTVQLRSDAAEALALLISAARAAGISAPLLLPVSGYRTKAEQELLWRQAISKHGSEQAARKWVAPPGHSAHGTGRAVDLYLGPGTADSEKAAQLRQTEAWKWLVLNARRFGWFPYDAESWHWEYGAPHATDGLTYAAEAARGQREGYLT